MRKTKIVCTVGPACDNKETLLQMIDAGMNVARFNMSHGTHEELKNRMSLVKEAIRESGKAVAILIDTKGPEVRIGTFENGSVTLSEGQIFSLMKNPGFGDEEKVSISYPKLVELLAKKTDAELSGMEILIDDGKLSLSVQKVLDDRIVCTVVKGGKLSNRKSINIPDFDITMPYMSKADRDDLEFGLSLGVQYVAASFVRSEDDVMMLRDYMDSLGYEDVEIISKIENQSGVSHIDGIIQKSDGIMVARGDMGVEIPFIKLPAIQKMLISKCIANGKYVITATQMLESMTYSPRPTRAEISDVANAVYDGTSAVMLSGESAAGQYPVESVKALASICREAESNEEYLTKQEIVLQPQRSDPSFRNTICMSAKSAAIHIGAKAIIVESKTGKAARTMAGYRPNCPVIAVVTSEAVCSRLALNWGITAISGEEKCSSDEITRQALKKAEETGIVQKGDPVIIISSNKANPTSSTDTLNIRIV